MDDSSKKVTDFAQNVRSRLFKIYVNLLFSTVEKSNEEAIQICIRGININEQDEYQRTLLHEAVCRGNKQIVILLIDKGIKKDEQDCKGYAPLHEAVCIGNAEIVELLLQHGVNIDKKDKKKRTPLHLAIERGQIGIVKILLEQGAKTDEKDENGFTPLHLAVYKGNEEIVELLLENGANIDAKDEQNDATSLHLAVVRGQTGIVKLLLDKGVKKDAKDKKGFTPLHLAVYKVNREIIELLLESGVNIDEKDQDGYTPLHLAVLTGYKNVVALLLENGAQVDIKNAKGLTPVYLIFPLEDYIDRVQSLLMGEEKKDHKSTYLEEWTFYKNVVALILKNRVQIGIKNEKGFTPLCLTLREEYINGIELLPINKKEEGDELLRSAIVNAHKKIVELLIKHDPKIDKNDTEFHALICDTLREDDLREASSLLDLAIINGQISAVDFLLKNGTQVNLRCIQNLSNIDIRQKKEKIAALLKENVTEQISAIICDYLKHLCPAVKIRVRKQEIEFSNRYTGKQLSKDSLIENLDKITAKKFGKVYDLLTQVHKKGQIDANIFSNDETRNLLEEYRGNFLIKLFIDILYYLRDCLFSGSYGPKTYGGKFFQELKSQNLLLNNINHDNEQTQITSRFIM